MNHYSKSLFSNILRHGFSWCCFVTYEIGSIAASHSTLKPAYIYIVYYALNISFFYSVVAAYKNNRSFIRAFAWLVGLLIIYALLKFFLSWEVQFSSLSFRVYLNVFLGHPSVIYLRAIYFTALALLYSVAGSVAELRFSIQQAENERLRTAATLSRVEAAYRSQQLNPHLLFNMLNFIYNKVASRSREAGRGVLLLADVLRYSLTAAGSDGKVALSAEVGQLHNLISVNELRFGSLFLLFNCDGNFEDFRIPPLVLLTLLENVFRHGKVQDPAYPAEVSLRVADKGRLTFLSRNAVRASPGRSDGAHIGLQQIRTRLDYTYPGGYLLEYALRGNYFELCLKLDL